MAVSVRGVIALLRWLPVNAISRLAGRFARMRLPGPLQRAQIRLFSSLVGADLAEARDPVESFGCFQDFFTRSLRAGVRPVDAAPDAFVAPCDGVWGSAGIVEGGTLLQVKGRTYSLAELLGGEDDARRFEGGAFATFYLSPRDYHRFHVPCAADVVSARYIPGRLWPVNGFGLQGVDGLFTQNERICTHLRLAGRKESICLVAVGATMVGSVKVAFDDLTTNRAGASEECRSYADAPHRFEKGEEWGRFEFGSTIVMVAEPGALLLEVRATGSALRLGERIGSIPSPGARG